MIDDLNFSATAGKQHEANGDEGKYFEGGHTFVVIRIQVNLEDARGE